MISKEEAAKLHPPSAAFFDLPWHWKIPALLARIRQRFQHLARRLKVLE